MIQSVRGSYFSLQVMSVSVFVRALSHCKSANARRLVALLQDVEFARVLDCWRVAPICDWLMLREPEWRLIQLSGKLLYQI